MMKWLQKLGKALMLPVAALPVCGILMGIGYALAPAVMGAEGPTTGAAYTIGFLLVKAGGALIDNMAWLFAIGAAVGLADDHDGTAGLAGLVSFLMMQQLLSPGVVGTIRAAVGSTLEEGTVDYIAFSKIAGNSFIGILAAVIGATCYNKFKSTKLPDWLAFFSGKRFVAIATGVISILVSVVLLFVWPVIFDALVAIGNGIAGMDGIGAGIYAFLNRLLIPTGLHHFVYGPFIFGPAVVEGGLQVYWAEHLQAFSQSTEPLKTLFPEGGFALHGNSKVFGSVGIALALYFTAAPENRVKVAGLLIPATLTAMLVGITEPLEFTFLFISPLLFAVHAVLAATMATVMYICGVVGNFGGGLLDQFLPQNWIPMFHHHASMMFIQIGIGLCFTALYFVVFRTLILRLNLKTPGREESEIKLYSKADYQAARGKTTAAAAPETRLGQAAGFLQALGGADNIESINNCATRLRIALVDMAKTQSDDVFKALGAHGVVRRGNGIQVIVGLHVPQVRDQLENLMKDSLSTEHTTMTEAVS